MVSNVRAGLYSNLVTVFPPALMNTTTSATLLDAQKQARLLENMLPSANTAGAGKVRYGCGLLVNTAGEFSFEFSDEFNVEQQALELSPGVNVVDAWEYRKSDGNLQILFYTSAGEIVVVDENLQSQTTVKTGLSDLGTVRAVQFATYLVFVNGMDTPWLYNGTTCVDLSEQVTELTPKDWASQNSFTLNGGYDQTERYAPGDTISVSFDSDLLPVSSITRTGTTATVTTTANHNLVTGAFVTIGNVTQTEYAGRQQITVTGANTFTYTVVNTATTPATIKADSINMVKGEVTPTYEFTQITDLSTALTSPGNEVQGLETPDGSTGFRIKFHATGGAPADMTVDVMWRKKGDTDWIKGPSYAVAGRGPITFETSGFDEEIIEVLLVAPAISWRPFLTVDEFYYQKPFGVAVSSAGNTLNSASIVPIVSITRSGTVATVETATSHGLITNDAATVYGASQTPYNNTFIVTVTDATHFTFTVQGDPATPATVDSNLPTTITYSIEQTEPLDVVIASSTYDSVSGLTTVVLTTNALPAAEVNIVEVVYTDSPPAFSDIYAEHDILWALSPGELKPKQYRGNDSLKVFYTDQVNNPNAWVNQSGNNPTQEINYIDITNKAGSHDELVKIYSYAGNMVFFGRKQLYIYAGDDPSTLGSFSWVKTVPVGCVHGNLVIGFPGDLLFFTQSDARSLRTVFTTGEAEVVPDLGSDVASTINTKIATLTSSNENYKKARSFYYSRDGFYGFKLDDDKLLTYALSEKAKGWVFLSGYFSRARSFLNLTDGRLIISVGGSPYIYANNADGNGYLYTDDGNPFYARWWTPWISLKGQRWASKHFELIMEESAEITVTLRRFKDWNTTTNVETMFALQADPAVWDESNWDVSYWSPTGASTLKKMDKFLCNSYSFEMETLITTGPLSFLGVRTIGG